MRPARCVPCSRIGPIRPCSCASPAATGCCCVLAEATPANDRSVDAVWWQLHMAALRVMHRADEFELLALNYCITYEVSPPPWEDPKGDYAVARDAAAASEPAVASFSLAAGRRRRRRRRRRRGHAALAGDLVGESLSTWQRLDAELTRTPRRRRSPARRSCASTSPPQARS